MNHPYSKEEEKNKKETSLQQSESTLGAEIEEQAMNGLYGMLESHDEDRHREES